MKISTWLTDHIRIAALIADLLTLIPVPPVYTF
jgi:hypothetical protein